MPNSPNTHLLGLFLHWHILWVTAHIWGERLRGPKGTKSTHCTPNVQSNVKSQLMHCTTHQDAPDAVVSAVSVIPPAHALLASGNQCRWEKILICLKRQMCRWKDSASHWLPALYRSKGEDVLRLAPMWVLQSVLGSTGGQMGQGEDKQDKNKHPKYDCTSTCSILAPIHRAGFHYTNTNLYILYIICHLLCSTQQKYKLYMYLYRAFNK